MEPPVNESRTDVDAGGQAESSWSDRPAAAVRTGLLVVLALAPLAVGLAALLGGGSAAAGALLGLLVPLVVLAITYVAVGIGRRRSSQAYAGALLASYLVKLVAVGALLLVLTNLDGPDRTALGLTAVVGLLIAVAVEGLVVTRSQLPYVDPVPTPPTP